MSTNTLTNDSDINKLYLDQGTFVTASEVFGIPEEEQSPYAIFMSKWAPYITILIILIGICIYFIITLASPNPPTYDVVPPPINQKQ